MKPKVRHDAERLIIADAERAALLAHIEEGCLQAERGELIDGEQVKLEIQVMKEAWLEERRLAKR